jgi:uncharacterized RDD family membrane protein YckC
LRDIGQVQDDTTPNPDDRSRDIQDRGRHRDDIPLGSHSVPRGRTVSDAVSILGSTTVAGSVDSDAVSIAGNTHIAAGARVGGAAVAVFGRVESHGEIGDEAVSVLGGMYINGPVGDQAVSVLGNLELGPKAIIDGDVVVVGGKLIKDPNAVVRGNEVHVSPFGAMPQLDWITTWVTRCLFLGRPLAFGPNLGWAWAIAFSFLAFYLLLSLLFPRALVRCSETLETRPGSSIVASLLTVFLTPVAIVLLAITIVGALLVPFLGTGLLAAKLFGKAVMLAFIGRRITRLFDDGRFGHPVLAVLVGGVIVMLLYTIPFMGFLTYKLLSWLGLGVVVYTIVLAMKRERPAVAAVGMVPPVGPTAAPEMYAVPPPAAAESRTPGPSVAPMVSPGFSAPNVSTAEVPRVPDVEPVNPPPPPEPPPAFPPPLTPATPPPPSASGFASQTPHPSAQPRSALPPISAIPPLAVISWPRAGLPIRLGALAIDGILIGLIMGLIGGVMPRALEIDTGPGGWLVALAIYGALMWKHKGTTIGGIVCGLKVVRVDTRPVDWATAIVRALACFLSLAVVGLGFIWIAIDDEKQSWHDKIAGTAVVVVPKGVSLV